MEYRIMNQTPGSATRQPLTDDERWQAVVERDRSAEGQFVLAVHTTGIFCRPCKRCKPTGASITDNQRKVVDEARRLIETSDTRLTLDEIASAVAMSPWHLQRLFKAHMGLSPAQYQRSHRSTLLRSGISEAPTVTHALHDAGYGSSSQFYATAKKELGMKPSVFRAGGAGQRIRYGIVPTWLGYVLVAATERGICSLQMGESEAEMRERLLATFPHAELIDDDPDFTRIIEQVVAVAEHPGQSALIPVDAHGTAFQHRVWNALRQIPAGSTRTYTEVAEAIGAPRAVRAVAKACADNPVPLIVPCHRVIGKDGSLTGYRYGIARKRALLEREATGD